MRFIFRDDDTSFFTPPSMLEQVYEPLWTYGIPVCLGVIPAQAGNVPIPRADETSFIDPNIPPAYRGRDRTFPVTDNRELCTFLDGLAAQGLVELCVHGYSHYWLEALTNDGAAFRHNLETGRAILAEAFPHAAIRTFLAPYERTSAAALDQIIALGMHTSLDPTYLPEGFEGLPDGRATLVQQSRIVVNAVGNPLDRPDLWETLLSASDPDAVSTCLHHAYMFFHDWGEPNTTMLSAWRSFCKRVVADHKSDVRTFSTV